MKKFLTFLITLVLAAVAGNAQDYSLSAAGQGNEGRYYVTLNTVLDKKQNKTALEIVRQLAVDGVMFKGISAKGGYPGQQPLIKDPTVRQLKAEFFNAFNAEKLYNNFVTLENESVSVTKLPKNKFEVSARLTVDKERLIQYLGEKGIIKTFDSLW